MRNKLIKKKIVIGILLTIFVIGIVILLFLLQKTTNNQSHATASTNINLIPATGDLTTGTQATPFQATVGQTIPVNIQIQPGTNAISYVQIEIDYDPSVLSVDQATGFTLTNASKMFFLEGPIYQSGKILASFDIGNTFVNALTQPTIVGSIPFQVIGNTDNTNGISAVTISTANTLVYSVAASDGADTNVLSSTQPFFLTAPANAPTATPTPRNVIDPTIQPTNTLTPMPTFTPVQGSITVTPTTPHVGDNITVNFSPTSLGLAQYGLQIIDDSTGLAESTTDPILTPASPTPGGNPTFTFHAVRSGSVHFVPTLNFEECIGTFCEFQNAVIADSPSIIISSTLSPTMTPTPTIAPHTVSIINFAFAPSTITVPIGTTVTWTNNSALNGGMAMVHTSTSDTGLWDSGPIQAGDSFSFIFNTAGTFSYHCAIHPSMQGTVIVTGNTTTPTLTPTVTPSPTMTLTPSPTPVPPGSAKLNLSLLLDGLGTAGDNTAPTLNTFSNKTPKTPTRNVSVHIVSPTSQTTYTGTVQYNPSTGTFDSGNNPITILSPFNTGNYAIYVTVPFYLTRLVAGIQQFHLDTTLSIKARLVAGDAINNNRLDLLDWNQLLTCQNKTPSGSCLGADVNDDGAVNQIDDNLFLREFGVEYGDSPIPGSN